MIFFFRPINKQNPWRLAVDNYLSGSGLLFYGYIFWTLYLKETSQQDKVCKPVKHSLHFMWFRKKILFQFFFPCTDYIWNKKMSLILLYVDLLPSRNCCKFSLSTPSPQTTVKVCIILAITVRSVSKLETIYTQEFSYTLEQQSLSETVLFFSKSIASPSFFVL